MSKSIVARLATTFVACVVLLVHASGAERSQDGTWLYLTIVDPTVAETERFPVLTWLRPEKPSACPPVIFEAFAPDQERERLAFSVTLLRVTPAGYEVMFQRVHPETEHPLHVEPETVLFERAQVRSFKLSEKLTVTGCYSAAPPPGPFNDI
jgi:hypothetical protein